MTDVTDQTFHITRSQYIDIGPTSPSTDPIVVVVVVAAAAAAAAVVVVVKKNNDDDDDTGQTSPGANPIMPGAWQGSPLECQLLIY